MTIIPEPTKVKLELMSNEIEFIIEELERAPYSSYVYFNYDKIVKKLKDAKQ